MTGKDPNRYSAGTVVAGREILSASERYDNKLAAKVRCLGCGKESLVAYRDLDAGRQCRCVQKKSPTPEVGDVVAGRTVTQVITGGRRTLVELTCPLCQKSTQMPTAGIRGNYVCPCVTSTKIKETSLARYGVENPSQHEQVKAARVSTCRAKYGCDYSIRAKEVQEKTTNTNMERYGSVSAFGAKDVQQKCKETLQQNYGVDNPSKSKQVRAKCMATCQAKYGQNYALQVAEIKAKGRVTCQEKYGKDYAMQTAETRDKSRATCREHYGHDNPMQSEELRTRALETRLVNNKNSQYRSKGELEVEAFIQSLGLEARHSSSGATEIDVLIPSLSVGIEFNGLYWHCDQRKDKQYHLDKKTRLADRGIDLIHLWEHLWTDRQTQVKGFLRAKLGKNEHRVGVRKCEVKPIESKLAREFLEKYHIQGAPSVVRLALGAFTASGELIAVATFAEHHRGGPQKVLNRLCSKENWTCSGFLGKAVREASKHFDSDIISWVDRCWSEGKSYTRAGFEQEEVLRPDYFYVNLHKTSQVIHKQSFRKIDERTEAQRATDEGLVKVWDCGKIRFIFRKRD